MSLRDGRMIPHGSSSVSNSTAAAPARFRISFQKVSEPLSISVFSVSWALTLELAWINHSIHQISLGNPRRNNKIRNMWFALNLLTFLALAEVSSSALLAADAAKPNIVLIFTDDQGYGDVGCYGAKGFETPNIDRLAQEGRRFTSFYVAQPVCSASRAALLTGCYPNRIGIHGALGPSSKVGINSNEVTLAELVRQAGYRTAILGKWHLGCQPQFLPTRHGFDEYYGLPYSNDMWPFHPEAAKGTYPDLPLIEGEKTIEFNPGQTKLTTEYTKHAVQFIQRNKPKPFFLHVAPSMPHGPLHVSEKFKGKSKAALYG